MRAPISVIIPTLDAEAPLRGSFAALMEGLESGLIREVIVSDGGSTDGTLAIARAAGAEVVSGAPSRGEQIGRGIAAAEGDWLLVLHADSWPEPGWAPVVGAHLGTGAPGYFRLRFRARGMMPRVVAGWANLRARGIGLPYGDQGLLIRRAELAALGGYPDLPLMEDVALARRLEGRLRGLDAAVETGAERYLAEGWLRRGARNLGLLAAYLAGAAPERLAARYRRKSG
ncbi:TIGR04283 family arsenosugar biosynthesis glycosyltransferase [Poseidonocella sedimentorum]|uniref:Transferase 2, rSAM/selenodomain-associated n=1 Tax=Poseidonocella sedimentorum TaxID=871652 RepID=A0A1I6EAR6_9RHOB|nr:TIGR04283 family arsenosugar biosynthesis glycosyltransferase [Poseidonocella sedimentorum]SFR14805.1 transferase 2, rSAM/selenodomain-associated [Poseidonocella sedimentorum]